VGTGLHDIWALLALGDLELGQGRADAAAGHLEELDALLRARGVADVDISPAAELAEAYVRLGRPDDARALAHDLEARAEAKGLPWSLAKAARTRGLLAADDDLDRWFGRALELHAQTPDVFATARTRLIYGERLRRARRRADARPELRQALQDFERLGAAPWAELARAELAATGETARRRELPDRDRLTPQELQIGLLLADGRTTREAAAAMFLSPKTIEYHQRNLYRKLDVRSRVELVAAMRALPDVGD
jgi:DNA-binding CsgD family transcriptional regulator